MERRQFNELVLLLRMLRAARVCGGECRGGQMDACCEQVENVLVGWQNKHAGEAATQPAARSHLMRELRNSTTEVPLCAMPNLQPGTRRSQPGCLIQQ